MHKVPVPIHNQKTCPSLIIGITILEYSVLVRSHIIILVTYTTLHALYNNYCVRDTYPITDERQKLTRNIGLVHWL